MKGGLSLKDIFALLRKIELYAAGLLFLSATTVMFVSVFFRMARVPIPWSLDVVLFLAAWSILLAADCALHRNRLVRVDTFVNFLPLKGQQLMVLLCHLIILTFLIVAIYQGALGTWAQRFRTFQGLPTFSYSWVALSAPVAFSFMALTMIGKIKEQIKETFFKPSIPQNENGEAEALKGGGE
jgi:TRAP-type C4-dicarboxylate transport system permease small subunit